jgi:hypothetical protein
MQNRAKVVVGYLDGRRLKGYTNDFSPARDHFFLFAETAKPGERGTPVKLEDLKAVFFVKDFAGDPSHHRTVEGSPPPGKKIEVTFADGEKMTGTTVAFNPKVLGFFIHPVDTGGNNERVFIVNRNVKQVRALTGPTAPA